MGGVKSWG